MPRNVRWSDADKARVMQMRADGRTPTEIAVALGRTPQSVRSLRANMQWGRSPVPEAARAVPDRLFKRPWTPREDHQLARLLAGGVGYKRAARMLGRPEGSTYGRAKRMGLAGLQADGVTAWRACLCCSREFPSEGPHNRLCLPCKAKI